LEKAWDRASDAADDAAMELLSEQTMTYAGAAALLADAAEFVESGNVWPAAPDDDEKSVGRDFSFYLRRNLAEDLAEIAAAA
jgi:hypothetical protein